MSSCLYIEPSTFTQKFEDKFPEVKNIEHYNSRNTVHLATASRPCSESMTCMINATKSVISKYFPQNPLKSSRNDKSVIFRLCIVDSNQNVESLRGYYIFVVVEENSIKFRANWTIRNEIFKIPQEFIEEMLVLISIVNLEQDLGYFNLLESNILQFELAIWYKNLEIAEIKNLIWPYIKKTGTLYCNYVQRFYMIINSPKVPDNNLKTKAYQTKSGDSHSNHKKSKSNASSDSETDEEIFSSCKGESNNDENSDSEEEYSFSDYTNEDSSESSIPDVNIIEFINSSLQLNQYFANYEEKNSKTNSDDFICIDIRRFLEVNDLPNGLLDDIMLALEKMYNHKLVFTEFPSQNIIIIGTEKKGYTFFLIYEDIDKVTKIRNENEIEIIDVNTYKTELMDRYSILVMQTLTNFYYPNFEISSLDDIPQTEFKSVNLTDNDLKIGQGGYGDVYKNELHGMKVAIKFPKEGKEVSAKAKARLLKEMAIMKSLGHDNITKLYGHTIYNNKFGLVIEYCSNGTLSDYVKNSREAKFQERLEFLQGITRGLEFMHCKNICHFDLKPQNIFLDDNNVPKIADFGMSEHLRKGLTAPPGFTLHYCAPEHIKGNNPNQSADIWSFGMTAYFLIMQKSPFDYLRKGIAGDLEPAEFCRKVEKENKRPEISENFRRHLPQIVRLFECTWELKPESRPSAKDVGCLINQWLISLKKKIVKAT